MKSALENGPVTEWGVSLAIVLSDFSSYILIMISLQFVNNNPALGAV